MPQVQLDDQLFKAAQRQAANAGFATVDEYVADMVANDLLEDAIPDPPNLDHLFTPERLAHIDAALNDVKAGHFYTAEQSDEELAKRRAEWLRNNPR